MLIGENYSYSKGRNLQYNTFWMIFCIQTFFVRNSGCLGLTEGWIRYNHAINYMYHPIPLFLYSVVVLLIVFKAG